MLTLLLNQSGSGFAGNATASPDDLTLVPASATASGGALATCSLSSVTLSPASATASGGAVATCSPASLSITSATGSASAGGLASCAPVALSITPAEGSAETVQAGNAVASPAPISITPAEGTASNNEQVTVAGGYDEPKKRKKNIVNHDGKLYVFSSDKDAIRFIQSLSEESQDNVVKPAVTPEPEREIRISEVETLEKVFKLPDSKIDVQQYIQFADYQAVIAAYDRWLEIDEEEALLLLI